jgi:pyruvate formate lyase activating enzyme
MTADTGVIFDVQRFSLHDGPGIRSTVFFKGCPLRCLWCQNPESHQLKPELAFYVERCQRCFRCATACPRDAITREPRQRILFSRCDGCGRCASACLHQGLRQIGRTWRIETLLRELLKDKDYFEDSGGGVTLSGGEPMMQSACLAELLPRLKEAGLHVNLETCGAFKWEQMEPLLPYLDLIYFDLKHLDATSHKRLAGRDNQIILDNFARLSKCFPSLQARMPIVPGMNDDADNLAATARFLTRHGQQTIHCLPYHNLGEAKIPRLHTRSRPLGLKSPTAGELELVRDAFEERGIHAIVYD